MDKHRGIGNRNTSIDSLRGIAALSVLTHHCSSSTTGIYGSLGTFGVILFFLISGYCIVFSLTSSATLSVKGFLLRRFFRLYPVYWLAVFASVVATPNLVSMTEGMINLTMLQRLFGVPDVNGVFWTLFLELIFYFIITFFLAINVSKKISTYPIVLSFFILLAFIFVIVRINIGIKIPFGHLMFLSVFFLGGWTCLTHFHNKSMFPLYLYTCVYLVIIFAIAKLITLEGVNPVGFSHNFYNYLWAVLLFFITLAFNYLNFAWLSLIGKISYPIYLLHVPVEWILINWISNEWLLWILVLFFTMAISLIVHAYIELKLISFGKKLTGRIKNVALDEKQLACN